MDTVEVRACVTDPCSVLTLDLHTVKVSDLAFRAPFSLPVRRDDFVHALIAWFDIEFSACHKPIKFSTGPHAKYTHWKQTVFYMRDVLRAKDGESVSGFLDCKPNQNNRRDLDIRIQYKLEARDAGNRIEGEASYRM